MRILHLLIGDQDGGAEMFFMRLGSALHARGLDQMMVMSPHKGRQSYFDSQNTPYICVDFNPGFGLWGRFRLHQILKSYQPDIIVAWMDRAARRLPKTGKAIKIGRVGGPYRMKYYERCDHVVVNSLPLLDHVAGQGIRSAVCIPNFVPIDTCDACVSSRNADDLPMLFYHGRLHPQKGLDVLIHAMVNLNARLVLAGDGPEKANLMELARDLGVLDKISFAGWQEDVSSHLRAADVYVFPSRYEGTSNSLLEAMAYGKAIVTTNGQSVSWFLEDGRTALIVDMDNVEQFSDAVARLLDDESLRKELGDSARRHFEKTFNEDIICAQWIDMFSRVGSGRNRQDSTERT